MIPQDPHGHERRRSSTDLRVEQKDDGLGAPCGILDALWKARVEEQRLAGLGVGLDEERSELDVADNAAKTARKGAAAGVVGGECEQRSLGGVGTHDH